MGPHFNEVSLNSAPAGDDFGDSSGNSNHGIESGGVTLGKTGKFSYAASFDGTNDQIALDDTPTLSITGPELSASLWIKPGPIPLGQYYLLLFKDLHYAVTIHTGGGLSFADSGNWSFANTGSFGAIVKDRWQHVAVVKDSTSYTFFIDGQSVGTKVISTTLTDNANPLYIGSQVSQSYYPGLIDEVAIWNRALHPAEVQQLYQRGASRLKHQVRTCTSSDCDGEPWQGPDGTPYTYFSELHNNTVPLTGSGSVKTTVPFLSFADFSSPPSNKRYFQYRSLFEADHIDPNLGPELQSVNVGPGHYPQVAPIYAKKGISFYELTSFSEALGVGGCSSGIGYNLSRDKLTWYWWDGAAWSVANESVAESNPAATVQSNSVSFGDEIGRGTVFVKAYLQSSGTSKCRIDEILLGGTQ